MSASFRSSARSQTVPICQICRELSRARWSVASHRSHQQLKPSLPVSGRHTRRDGHPRRPPSCDSLGCHLLFLLPAPFCSLCQRGSCSRRSSTHRGSAVATVATANKWHDRPRESKASSEPIPNGGHLHPHHRSVGQPLQRTAQVRGIPHGPLLPRAQARIAISTEKFHG